MTKEEEWHVSQGCEWMFEHLYTTWPRRYYPDGAYVVLDSRRKLQLFSAGCLRRLSQLSRQDWHKLTLESIEEIADLPDERENAILRSLLELHRELGQPCHPENPALDMAVRLAAFPQSFRHDFGRMTCTVDQALRKAWGNRCPPGPDNATLLRDIFGNPFRPVTFAPDWRTEAAVGIAAKMYESRDFGNMPILADALQDAGCEHADILAHCREPGTHVRGCWVVDLVLGKS